jgi:hypothetical protein
MVQQQIEHAQVRRLDLDLSHGGDLLRTLHRSLDGREGDLLAAGQGRPQGVLDGGLAFPGRPLQDSQVLPRRRLLGMRAAQRVVRHAKMARGEQVLAIHVLGKRAGLADQRVDDVPVVDRMFAGPRQTRHALDKDARMPHLHLLDADHHVHLLADQAAVHRVRVPQDLDRAARPYRNVGQPPAAFQTPCRKRAERGQLFRQPLLPVRIAAGHQVAEEPQVLLPVGEVAAATQPQGLVHRRLEMPVRRFRVAVLVRLADVDPLPFQGVVVQEILVSLAKLPLVGEVVHRRRETVAAVPSRNSPQLPQGVLQTLAQRLEGLRRAQRDRFPVRVRQGEMKRQVRQRLAGDGHPQRIHVREIGGRQVAGVVDLSEHHRLVRPLRGPPGADLPLEGSPLAVGELPPLLALEPAKQRDRLQAGLLLEPLFNPGPDLLERIEPGPPVARSRPLRGQLLCLSVLACGLLIHVRVPCRQGQPSSHRQQPKQLSHLTVLDHRNLLFYKGLRL